MSRLNRGMTTPRAMYPQSLERAIITTNCSFLVQDLFVNNLLTAETLPFQTIPIQTPHPSSFYKTTISVTENSPARFSIMATRYFMDRTTHCYSWCPIQKSHLHYHCTNYHSAAKPGIQYLQRIFQI